MESTDAFNHPKHGSPLKPVVSILLSDRRSGSTLFERELCSHPDIRHVDFTPHSYHETHFWLKAACALETPADSFANGKRPATYGTQAAARDSLAETMMRNVPDFRLSDDSVDWVTEGWEAICRKFARPVFFEKSPQNPQHWAALALLLKWVRQTDFDVRVIGLIRNPMAVIHSAGKRFNSDPVRRQYAWVQTIQHIIRLGGALESGQFHFLRYEEMVAEPAIVFESVCRFIGVSPLRSMGSSVTDESLGKWRRDPGFRFELAEDVTRFAINLGYPEIDLTQPRAVRD